MPTEPGGGWTSRSNPPTPSPSPGRSNAKRAYELGPKIAGLDYPLPPATPPAERVDMETGEVLEFGAGIPVCDTGNPADLEAWFGNFGYADHWRKVVLASAREIARAKATEKLTEAKLDDLARTSDMYIGFLTECLNGRRLREQNVIDSNRRGC